MRKIASTAARLILAGSVLGVPIGAVTGVLVGGASDPPLWGLWPWGFLFGGILGAVIGGVAQGINAILVSLIILTGGDRHSGILRVVVVVIPVIVTAVAGLFYFYQPESPPGHWEMPLIGAATLVLITALLTCRWCLKPLSLRQ